MQREFTRGWNTWNTRSVLSHVLLPQGLALNLGIKEYSTGFHLREALVGRHGTPGEYKAEYEQVTPGARSYDGSYSDLRLLWKSLEARVQSGLDGDDLVLLVTPLQNQIKPATLVVECGLLWNNPGYVVREDAVQREEAALRAHLPHGDVQVFAGGTVVEDSHISALSPYLALRLDQPIVICTGHSRTVEDATRVLDARRGEHENRRERFGAQSEAYDAMQTCLAWDTIYDPDKKRAISPVSRVWNVREGGWALFCWDTFFAAYMAGADNRELAYANAVEMLREKTPQGFVPNVSNGHGFKSLDRSQPPVGSLVVRELYRLFGDTWFVQQVFDDLLQWNRWWIHNRCIDGLLAWGSNPYEPQLNYIWEMPEAGVGGRFGAALESGLDNSPMYDDIPFDGGAHVLKLQDVGLNGLYVRDCECLADLAQVLGRDEDNELRDRAQAFRDAMQQLWSEDHGLFLNRRTDTGELSTRISPTNFYALLADAATPQQAQRMVDEHLLNPQEFGGEWMLPSIARDDAAYADQDYWRGRIWAPMNFLVYLGLRRYDLPAARHELAAKSEALLLKEWREHGHVHENYHADSGSGCDAGNSDRFYHWGGLLGTIALIEAGHLPGPEQPLGN
jgi:hypothetical protein